MLSEKKSDESKLEAAKGRSDVDEVEFISDNADPAAILATPPAPATLDGGPRAWLQVVGAVLIFINIWGFLFIYGSFQAFYELEYLPSQSASNISWVGTICGFLLIITGVFSGPLFDSGYFKTLLIVGAVVESLGIFLLSLSTKYYQIVLCQGVLVGVGSGLLYLPGLALVGRSFKKHRAIAMAIVSCGAPLGGIIFTLVFERLIDPLGFAWTVRIMGFIILGSYAIAFPLLLWGASNLGDLATPGTKRKLIDRNVDLPFWVYTMSNFFLYLGYMVPFFYLPVYGQKHLGLGQSTSLNLIVIAQATSVLGRLVCGYFARKVGVMIPWIICGLSSGILCIGWVGVRSEASLFVFAALYGAFSGALIPLPPSVFPVVCQDPSVLGTRLGMSQAICSIANLLGPPIAGALLGLGHGRNRYIGLQLFTGLIMFIGGLTLISLWILLVRTREVSKLI